MHGSPITEYSVHLTRKGVPEAPQEIWRGSELNCCIGQLEASGSVELSLVAHAVGGSSAASPPVELLPAPQPIDFDVVDDGSCSFTASDRLKLRFDQPTNRVGAVGNSSEVNPASVAQLLEFVPPVGPMRGRCRALVEESGCLR